MILKAIEKRSNVSKKEFENQYLKANKPVVFKDLIQDWPAYSKWDFEYFIQKYGEVEIPIYDQSFSKAGKSYMSPTGRMLLGDYLRLIQNGSSNIRIFLLNILALIPELKNDLGKLSIMDGFIDSLPFMFFGGKGAYTKIHYDLDCSHVFLTHFQTKKRVLLFAPDQSDLLGPVPFTVGCLINPIDPDEGKYPGLKYLRGYETTLEHGETLFMPSKFWHHIEYTESGFSIAYRAFDSVAQRLNGIFHITQHMMVDRSMNFLLGDKWAQWKVDQAKSKQRLPTMA
ncbi:MAG: cupin-like domain-containing protein [Saprospiraceae bacterium]|nr:cupin-like domain-containing protein [Saprospiraceae bacterium]